MHDDPMSEEELVAFQASCEGLSIAMNLPMMAGLLAGILAMLALRLIG